MTASHKLSLHLLHSAGKYISTGVNVEAGSDKVGGTGGTATELHVIKKKARNGKIFFGFSHG
jgi:hypothetical protein